VPVLGKHDGDPPLFTPGTRVTRLAPSSHAIPLAGPPPASRRFGRVAYCLAGSWVAVW